MLGRPKCLHSFVETDHLSGGGGEGKDDTPNTQKSATPLSPPSVAPADNLRSRRNLTLIAKVLQTSVSLDTFETNESYLQNMAYPFIFSAYKLMLNKFCTDFVDVSMKFEYIEASPKLSDLPTFYNPSYSSFGSSLPLYSPAYRIVSTLGSKIPSEHEFHAKSTQMFIESRPTVERLKSPSLHPLLLPLLQVRPPLDDFILSVGDSREDNDHVIDQAESTLPPSLQLDNELKEESTLLSGTYVPTHSRSPVVLALILPLIVEDSEYWRSD
ncbi:hypothetical protein BLNAU_1694 [Blattamonas nauphoetae]|uniref:Uncharacterized protein n=2 Tax=Blattamonas nauphoetae TaxID=2049346 RepID=A0ABQ9YHC4_9EUKA|nr:hypothetical protein BLNAU_7368 [Blattamonas nauphoetae]KAK2963161.1 hypothetical protein BLNAU_1694 [Blattamonas nauphoetae]